MKNNILRILAILYIPLFALSCTKHDPFDTLGGGNNNGGSGSEEEEELWILSKFAKTNAIDFAQNNITFFETAQSHVLLEDDDQYDRLPDPDIRAYYSYDDLKEAGILETPVSDGKGNYYRVPTAGELMMIFPGATAPDDFWGILDLCATSSNSKKITEIVYLQNGDDSSINEDGEKISGESSFYFAVDYNDGNDEYNPVFAIRFKGTSQYAAYRYDIEKIKAGADGGFLDIMGIRVRAVKLPQDIVINIENVEEIEELMLSGSLATVDLLLPMVCMMHGDVNRYLYGEGYGSAGYLLSSTVVDNSYIAKFSTSGTALIGQDTYGTHMRYPLRLLKCKADGSL